MQMPIDTELHARDYRLRSPRDGSATVFQECVFAFDYECVFIFLVRVSTTEQHKLEMRYLGTRWEGMRVS